MTIRFGVSPIAWINDDMPELGGDTPIEQVFEDCMALGLEGIELGGKFPRDPAILGPLLKNYNLDLIGGWYSSHLLDRDAAAEIAAMQDHLNLLEAMGSKVFINAECSTARHGVRSHPLKDQPILPPDGWKQFGDRLNTIAEYVTGRGFRFAYHYHLGTCVENASDIDAFTSNTADHVGFVVDTGHAVLGGINPVELIERFPQRVNHVHAKDVRWAVFNDTVAQNRSFLDGVLAGMFTVPGDGAINFSDVMSALKRMDYSGWIVIEAEQDPALANPTEYCRMGLGVLEREARAAGLTGGNQ